MKEDPKELTEKKYVQLIKKRDEIWDKRRNLPYRKLKEPIQDGWNLSVELSEEASRRDDAIGMSKALALATVKGKAVTRDSKKISRVRKDSAYSSATVLFSMMLKDYDGVYRRHYYGPHIHSIDEKTFNKIDDPRVPKWFKRTETTRVLRWNGQTVTEVRYDLTIREHYLVVKVKKRMIIKVQDIDPVLEKAYKEVEDELAPYYRTLARGGAYWRYDIKHSAPYTRKRAKIAIKKVRKGEIDDMYDFHKLSKNKIKK